jgi:CheY-like chemotaxis protein
LVVDDDLISRHALSLSMKKAFSQPDLAVDGESALAQATRQVYDVIFLDVQMPGMDGFELCTKIRDTVPNRTTPVVFVTSHGDFDACAQSTISGGNDLMGKPFMIFEVTVKALTFALRGRLQQLNS